jgi:hypothetical protein
MSDRALRLPTVFAPQFVLNFPALLARSPANRAIFPDAVKVHCANNGAWIGAVDFVQACLL